MNKPESILTDAEMHALISGNPFTLGMSIARLKDFIRQVEKAAATKLVAEQEPVTEIDYFGDTCCPVFGDRLQLKRGTKLYAHPMPCVSPTSDKAACVSENAESDTQELPPLPEPDVYGYRDSYSEELLLEYAKSAIDHHRTTNNHITDAGQMVVPHGYRLVKLADIDTAIQRASVFDDGGDGADPESARSCIEILRGMISNKAADSLEPKKEVVHDRHTGKELLYIPPAGESLYSMAQTRKEFFSLALSIDTKEALALLQSYLNGLDDWQLVPKQPTDSMLACAKYAQQRDQADRNSTAYRAMLAAAPKYTGDSNE